VREEQKKTYLILLMGLLAISTAAPFIRLAREGTPDAHWTVSFAISFWRLLMGALIYGLIAWPKRGKWFALEPKLKWRFAVAGFCLAAHFAFWIGCFGFTDLQSGVLLLVFEPILAAFVGGIFFGEKITSRTIAALVLSVIGVVAIVGDDIASISLSEGLGGDIMAILGCASIVAMYAVGRPLRGKVPFAVYMTALLGYAAFFELVFALSFGTQMFAWAPASWLWFAMLALITTCIGHASMNYVLPRVTLFTLNLVIIAEPVLAIIINAMLYNEGVSPWEIAGGLLLSAAVIWGLGQERKKRIGAEMTNTGGEIAR